MSEDSSIGHYQDLQVLERSSQQSYDISDADDEEDKKEDDSPPLEEIKENESEDSYEKNVSQVLSKKFDGDQIKETPDAFKS